MKPTLTAAIITLNERRNLPGLLVALDWVDEIVVVDGGSRDGTVEMARQAGARVDCRPFRDYQQQRNLALDMATSDWVLTIDADERPTRELRDEVLAKIRDVRNPYVAFRVPIRSTILGRPFHFAGTQDDRPIRLYRRRSARWTKQVHEAVEVRGPVGRLNHVLLHDTLPTVEDFLRKVEHYTTLEAVRLVAEGRRLRPFEAYVRPPAAFLRRYVWKLGMFDGWEGLVFCALSAFSTWVKCAKLRRSLGSGEPLQRMSGIERQGERTSTTRQAKPDAVCT